MISNARILVVDDDAGARRLARATLSRAGFSIVEAADGQAALEAMAVQLPDLVLMDVNMPRMDGFEACAALRAMPGGNRVPVAMMTGLDDTPSIDRAFEVGATDFITKPINWSVLPHRVRYMLRASIAINELQQNQRRLSNAQRIGEMGDWEWDVGSDRLEPSMQAWRLFGHPGDAAHTGLPGFFATVHADDAERLQRACERAVEQGEGFAIDHRVLTWDGAVRHLHQQVEVIERIPGGPARRLAGAVHDVTRVEKDAEEQIRRLAYFDPLTGLPNRLLFTEQLARALAQAERHGRRIAIMFVDLDNFEARQRHAGPQGRRRAAQDRQRAGLAGALRGHDVVARSGDTRPAPLVPRPAPLDLGQPAGGHTLARLGGDEVHRAAHRRGAARGRRRRGPAHWWRR
ncbi:response regulator [Paucibacter sp. O1-1]|nr:response regulator [Paucibacter sp. O1-1]MDA3830089.1 response regulator [Paucibacter sp. O1-1]